MYDAAELMRRLAPLYDYPVALVLDTDAYNEVDDQFALAYTLLSPEIDLKAIYAAPFLNDRATSPAEGMEKSYDEIFRILRLSGFEGEHPPVYKGSETFMASLDEPVDSPAARDLIERGMARPKDDPLYVAAIGCPVNVSSALLLCPDLADHIVVAWLGGTARYWNHGEEFNLVQDIHASRILFNSGVPLIRFPTQNVTDHLTVTPQELEYYLGDAGLLGRYLTDCVANYVTEERKRATAYSKVIWDIIAIAWFINPDWIESTILHSPILGDDHRFAFDNTRHFIREAIHVDRDAVFTDLYRKLGSDKLK